MQGSVITGEDLTADPGYPYVAHIQVERLRLDPRALPPQRRKADGTPVCLAGDHRVTGDALLCTVCRKRSKTLSKQRERESRRTDVVISKAALISIHEQTDGLLPLLGNLTIAYNTGGDLRDEMNRVMLACKRLKREIDVLLPDPRVGPAGPL